MIISVKQTASNIAQTYEVSIDGTYVYAGSLGRFHRFQPIELMDKNNTPVLKGRWCLSKWIHYLPFAWVLAKHTVTRKCVITGSTGETASIGFTRQRAFEDVYTIWLPCGEELKAYAVAVGDYEYVSIYRKDHQVALLELYLTAIDYCYTYKMYVLEEIAEQKAWLTFFVLYYANQNHTHRFHMSKGTVRTKKWSFSRSGSRYDPTWREVHFPHENFFGKIHLYD